MILFYSEKLAHGGAKVLFVSSCVEEGHFALINFIIPTLNRYLYVYRISPRTKIFLSCNEIYAGGVSKF